MPPKTCAGCAGFCAALARVVSEGGNGASIVTARSESASVTSAACRTATAGAFPSHFAALLETNPIGGCAEPAGRRRACANTPRSQPRAVHFRR
jgi:hypothetical protein